VRDPGVSKIKQGEIIWSIAKAIKPCKCSAGEAAKVVEAKLRQIMKLTPPPGADIANHASFGTRGANRRLAKRIGKHLTEIEKAIAGAPDGSRFALFAVALYPEGKRPEELAEDDKIPEWGGRLCRDLAALNRACRILEREPIGDYHEGDYCKKLAVGAAFDLVFELSAEPPSSSSPDSPLRAVATLIYERVTGKPHVDLEAYCDEVARQAAVDLSLQKDRKINPDKS
jgi:hypothetical protein